MFISSYQLVFAGSICLKNKDGVDESWQTSDKDVSMFSSNDACAKQNARPIAPQQPVLTTQAQVMGQMPQINVQSKPVTNQSSYMQVQRWDITPADQNMRLLINKWSNSVNWTMHWAVDKEIPIVSPDSVAGDFKTAIRHLLSATALNDLPVKPCFYTNNVVRVVRETSKCNPNE